MSEKCTIDVNGRLIHARRGDTLVDAGLLARLVIPHDCCSGQCQTCRVRVMDGAIDDRGTLEGGTVLACQATIEGDAMIAYDEVPPMTHRSGTVRDIVPLSPEVLEVTVSLASPLDYLPGQYVSAKFSGYPARDYSPTVALDAELRDDELVFHIKVLRDGVVSSALRTRIRVGHRVRIRGPLGRAFLREPAGTGALVLMSTGTGWAPIWSIARAACLKRAQQRMIVIAGARERANLYMTRALDWLADQGVSEIIATVSSDPHSPVLPGRPTHYLPSLGPEDTVYVAGSPRFVGAAKRKARAALATCYADPFLPGTGRPSILQRMSHFVRSHAALQPSLATAAQ